MWTRSEKQAARSLAVLTCGVAVAVLLIALQLVGRSGHANVVPVKPSKHIEPGPIDRDDDDVRFAFTLRTCAGFVGTLLLSAVASSVGTGGGAFYVPLFYAVSGFSLKAATGLSQAAIAGGSFVTLGFNLLMRHPWDPGRPLVDLDLALVMTPALLLGVSVGVLLNEMLPTWAVLLLLVALLALTSRSVTIRGLNLWAEERQRVAAAEAAAAIQSGPHPQLPPISIAHVPSAALLAPRRLQVVISREPSRAQIADSSDDDESGGIGTGGGSRRARAAAAAAAAATAEAAAAAAAAAAATGLPPPLPPEGFAAAGEEGAGPRVVAAVGRALTTVPSGDSEDMEVGAHKAGAAGDKEEARHQQQQEQQELAQEQQQQDQQEHHYHHHHHHHQQQQQQQQQQAGDQQGDPQGTPGRASPRGVGGEDAFAAALAAETRIARGRPGAAAAAAGAFPRGAGPLSPAASASTAPSPRAGLRFPWIKLVSLTLLWLGFLGLSALDALLPLCSLQYIAYILLFLVTTLGVTAMFIRAIFLEPSRSVGFASLSGRRKPWLLEAQPSGGAASDAGVAGSGTGSLSQPLLDGGVGGGSSRGGGGGSGVGGGEASGGCGSGAGGGGGGSSGFGRIPIPDPDEAASEAPAALSAVAALSAAVAGAAGLLAGAAGLGGGTMLGSALLDFRVHPQVATATSSVLLFVGSSAATLSYVMEGRLIFSYAAAFAACAAAGSAAGALSLAGAVRRSGRSSTYVLAAAAAIGAGAALTAGLGAWDIANETRRVGLFGGLSNICR